MPKLSPEQEKELADLEKEVDDEIEADAVAARLQHLDALKLRKKYTASGKKHGIDVAVVETKIGNFVVRKPKDVEIDTVAENEGEEGRAASESFVSAIVLYPTATEVQALFPENPGLAGALGKIAIGLAKVSREDEAKK